MGEEENLCWKRRAASLPAWVRGQEGGTSDSGLDTAKAFALCLNETLVSEHRARDGVPWIDALAFHASSRPRPDRAFATSAFLGGFGGSGSLAISTQGPGVGVVKWGVEASTNLDGLRE